jgi:hypothetical protein
MLMNHADAYKSQLVISYQAVDASTVHSGYRHRDDADICCLTLQACSGIPENRATRRFSIEKELYRHVAVSRDCAIVTAEIAIIEINSGGLLGKQA